MDNRLYFKEAGFGMMMHFGLYSLLGGEWKGRRMPYIGEWIQAYMRIPNKEYHALADVFDPVFFDAEYYVKTALAVGMKYFVVTAKHHDGFALYRSRADKFNSFDSSACHRDFIAELAEACYKYGLKFGVYYSQEIDWSHPHGGGYHSKPAMGGTTSRTNNWDFPDDDAKDYGICLEEKILPQLDELLTGYGDIFLVWCDTPLIITPEQSRRIYDLIKTRQPDCLVNSRIGNGLGDYRSTQDNQVSFDKGAVQDRSRSNMTAARIAEDQVQTGLYECPATLNDTWGWKSFDQKWKTPEQIRELRKSLNSRGINYLLNVGPDNLGRMPAAAADIFTALSANE